jgi:exodeoxyribonuclease VII small subunit
MVENELTFEQAMDELEDIIVKLETGGLPLETSIALFERGRTLMGLCNRTLDEAELRLQKVRLAADGSYDIVPLDDPKES